MNTHRSSLVPLTISVIVAGFAGYWWGHSQRTTVAAPAAATERKIQYWYDPMVPNEHYDKPGLSSMGMQTQPKYADAGDAGGVRIDPRTIQNLGVRTVVVERRVLAQEISAPATIGWDLREASVVSARVDGIVTRLHVRAPFDRVAVGEPLMDVLAPQWNAALAERAALAHAQSPEAQALHAAAGERLQVLGLSGADLKGSSHGVAITLHALQAGTITALDVREGQRVMAGQTLMTINGSASVWVDAALPQGAAGMIATGTPATVTLDAQPGREFHGTVEALLPDIDPMTRTQRARIVLANGDGTLSPGQFAHVRFAAANGAATPVVPDEALVATGAQTRVIVADGDGRFHPVVVTTGRSSGGYTAIVSGLTGGEHVVVSGQFLIDSEASLSGALDRIGSDGAKDPTP